MKFMHLSDLHFGIKLHEHDVTEDQNVVWKQIYAQLEAEKPDAIVIAGDVYNRSDPNSTAIAQFQRFLLDMRAAAPQAKIMIVAGNHDDATRIDQFREFLASVDVHMIGRPPVTPEEHIEKITLEDEFGPVNFYLLPFFRPNWVKEIVGTKEDGTRLSSEAALKILLERENIDWAQRNVVVSHQYYAPFHKETADVDEDYLKETMGNEEAISGDLVRPFDYAALGHIHRPSNLGDVCHCYCGTPTAYSQNEVGQKKSSIIVEMGPKGSIEVRKLPLIPLRKIVKIKGTMDEILKQACDDYVAVTIEGDNSYDTSASALLSAAFPHLLTYAWERQYQPNYDVLANAESVKRDPLEWCLAFLGDDLTDKEIELLKDIVDEAKGEC